MKPRTPVDTDRQDEELLTAIGNGDRGAFSELYDRYSAAALGVAFKICGDKAIAEDVVQEAFLSVWRRPSAFNPERGTVAGYLFGAVHHKAVDAIRHEEAVRRRQEAAFDLPEASTDDEMVHSAWVSVRRDRVRAALQRLSGVQREALELAYLEGLTYSEVALKLSIPLGTAKTRLRDGMIRLRNLLSEEAGELT